MLGNIGWFPLPSCHWDVTWILISKLIFWTAHVVGQNGCKTKKQVKLCESEQRICSLWCKLIIIYFILRARFLSLACNPCSFLLVCYTHYSLVDWNVSQQFTMMTFVLCWHPLCLLGLMSKVSTTFLWAVIFCVKFSFHLTKSCVWRDHIVSQSNLI